MKKYAKAHDKMALATGETKTRAKLTKSKHGWLKIAMGLTFASTALFTVGKPTHADVQASAPVAVATTQSSNDQKTTEQANSVETDSDAKQTATSDQNTQPVATDAKEETTDQSQSTDVNQATVTEQKDQSVVKTDQPATKADQVDNQLVTKSEQNDDKIDQPTQVTDTEKSATPEVEKSTNDNDQKTDAVKTDAKSATNDTQAKQQVVDVKSNQTETAAKETKTIDQVTPTKVTTDVTKQSTDQVETKNDIQNSDQKRATRLVNLAVQTAAQNLSTANMTKESGSYTVAGEQNVRDNPSLSGNITGQLQAGDTINYDGKVQADGYTWLHYMNYENKDRWVAQLASATTSHSDFINSLSAGALETWRKYGVLPSISIAQAIVESAWGQAAPGNNLFGIKGSYNGQSVTVSTQEWINGRYVTIQDRFRAYPSFAESVQDHGYFLYSNSRYSNLLGNRDYAQVAWMLQSDGYATSPTYASTLISVIRANNLTRFDQNLDNPTMVPGNGNNNTGMNQERGSYTLSGPQNVRTDASLSAGVTGQLQAGDTIYYDGTREADGYKWLHYNNYAGQDRWVADLNGANQTPTQPAPTPTPTPEPNNNNNNQERGSYTLSGPQNVRTDASLSAGVTGQLQAGDTIYYDGTREADGYKWLHYNNYAGQDRWVADLNGANQTPTQPAPTPTPEPNNNNNNQERGSYTLSGPQNVRTDASLSAGVTGQLQAGDTIYYDGTREADGYKWLHYNNYAGQDRWVADLNSGSQPTTPTNNDNGATVKVDGNYTVRSEQNVRTGASLSDGVTGQLQAGDTIRYDAMKQANGYTWLHYVNFAGADRWIAQL
ncbi:SH3 domain-containing protein [Fructilactobacillus cliffordii]|uniref:SH3 domain-containing protein n=1 Tax=Fructilactobacillus cliffordii TaxID=2940299 RepID=UPI00209278C0|nr:SH3 domain-containing protein [Fructilactobacillus cliffordii]USS87164.1 SH3 domain-containing protein [Fructilactobacillus cliffordii]